MKASTLEQISEKIDYGFTASAATKLDGPRFLRITDIQNGQVDWEHVPGCQCSDLEFERFRIEPGDIVFARTGATTGKSFLIECVPEGGAVFASYLIRLRPRKSVDPSYLAHFFKTPQYWHQISTKSTGSTQPGVNASKLATLSVPLPPLEEQKRIAAILDKADAILRKREQAIKLADEFLRSLFLDMFGDPVRNPKNWPKLEFEKVADSRLGKMLDGRRQTGLHKRSYLRNANVQWNEIDIGQIFEMDFDNDDREEFRLVDGDVVICEGGQPGRAAIWRAELEECYFQKALHRARPSPDKLTPDYLVYSLMFLSERGGFKDFVTSATIAHLTGEKLKQLPLAIPPIEHQKKFAAASDRVRALKGRIKHAQALEASFASTLTQKAFRGEL